MPSKVRSLGVAFGIALVVCLYPSSLAAQTNAGGVTLETVLKKNDRAPFEGVLVPYPQYYYYNEQVEVNFEREIAEPDCSCFEQTFWPSTALGLTAFLAGLLLASPK